MREDLRKKVSFSLCRELKKKNKKKGIKQDRAL